MTYTKELTHKVIVDRSTPEGAFQWILDIINSCENSFQLDCCRSLIDLFYSRYGSGEFAEELTYFLHVRAIIISIP